MSRCRRSSVEGKTLLRARDLASALSAPVVLALSPGETATRKKRLGSLQWPRESASRKRSEGYAASNFRRGRIKLTKSYGVTLLPFFGREFSGTSSLSFSPSPPSTSPVPSPVPRKQVGLRTAYWSTHDRLTTRAHKQPEHGSALFS